MKRQRQTEAAEPGSLFVERDVAEGRKLWIDLNNDVSIFYDEHDRFTPTNKDRNKYTKMLEGITPQEHKALARSERR